MEVAIIGAALTVVGGIITLSYSDWLTGRREKKAAQREEQTSRRERSGPSIHVASLEEVERFASGNYYEDLPPPAEPPLRAPIGRGGRLVGSVLLLAGLGLLLGLGVVALLRAIF
jgi:ferric-dicitrate binding protein FerR (iron transport regulator)